MSLIGFSKLSSIIYFLSTFTVSTVTYLQTTLRSLSLAVVSVLNFRLAHWTFLYEWPRNFSNLTCLKPKLSCSNFPPLIAPKLSNLPKLGNQGSSLPISQTSGHAAHTACKSSCFSHCPLLLSLSGLIILFLDCSNVFIVGLSVIIFPTPPFFNFIFGQSYFT